MNLSAKEKDKCSRFSDDNCHGQSKVTVAGEIVGDNNSFEARQRCFYKRIQVGPLNISDDVLQRVFNTSSQRDVVMSNAIDSTEPFDDVCSSIDSSSRHYSSYTRNDTDAMDLYNILWNHERDLKRYSFV